MWDLWTMHWQNRKNLSDVRQTAVGRGSTLQGPARVSARILTGLDSLLMSGVFLPARKWIQLLKMQRESCLLILPWSVMQHEASHGRKDQLWPGLILPSACTSLRSYTYCRHEMHIVFQRSHLKNCIFYSNQLLVLESQLKSVHILIHKWHLIRIKSVDKAVHSQTLESYRKIVGCSRKFMQKWFANISLIS
jgi:hypothetical protein